MIFLFSLFLLFTAIQICYHLCIFQKFAFHHSKKNVVSKQEHPVSVVICAKDESENLKKILPSIFEQNYGNYQIILINDRSTDNTLDVFEEFRQKYPRKTQIINVQFNENPVFRGNKKYALSLGIKAAENPYLLFTDADCHVPSNNWIQEMATSFNKKNTEIVLGYGKYQKNLNSFLNKLIRYETLQTAIQYFSYALKGMPYMGVGRNLAYTKDLFMKNNGFYNHLRVLSGDDDLFVNENADSHNTNICISPESFTVSKPKQNLKTYLFQKRRHISTAKYYKTKHKLLLGTYYISLVAFWILSVLLLTQLFWWKTVLAVVALRFLVSFIINSKAAKKLDESDLVWFLPILEPSLILLQFYIFVHNLISKPKTWA